MKSFKELTEARRTTVEDELINILSKKLKVSYNEAKDFLIGSARPDAGMEALNKATKMGYNEYESSERFWAKIYTPVEYAVAMAIAAGDYNLQDLQL